MFFPYKSYLSESSVAFPALVLVVLFFFSIDLFLLLPLFLDCCAQIGPSLIQLNLNSELVPRKNEDLCPTILGENELNGNK